MILYLTSPQSSFEQVGPICEGSACALSDILDRKHYCFSTEPLAGKGKFVYSIDIPQQEAEKYEYDNPFQDQRVRFFALPQSVVSNYKVERGSFDEITGRPWNEWIVPVLDRRAVRNPKMRGRWAIVWASREGIASARVHEKKLDHDSGEPIYIAVQIRTTSEFDPTKDYILVENHEEFTRLGGVGVKETWNLRTLAGVEPEWAVYPKAWQAFVANLRVRRSAINFILRIAPEVADDVRYAEQRISKFNKARAWRNVAEQVSKALTRRLKEPISLGKFAAHSWTQINAMPIRIAKRASQHLPENKRWIPPIPEPVYVDPDRSGRYVLANLYGAYPTRGPGVDHAPQIRPYHHLEGELDRS